MPLPADIVNRALDAISLSDKPIGAMTDGTRESEAARRIYGPTLRQLLRTAHWSWARKNAPLLLLGDSSGQTLAPSGEPISTAVELPWLYAYAWPNDGVRARWLPWQQSSVNAPAVPIMTGLGTASPYPYQMPARFLVSSSDQFPVADGVIDWDNMPDLSGEGVGLLSRRIVLTNVPNASLVYTQLVLEIEMWDALFTEVMIAVLASRLALPLVDDKKLAIALRGQQVALAKDMITQARVANANEAGWPQSVDHTPDWIRARTAGGWAAPYLGGDAGLGVLRYGWEAMSWADGSVM